MSAWDDAIRLSKSQPPGPHRQEEGSSSSSCGVPQGGAESGDGDPKNGFLRILKNLRLEYHQKRKVVLSTGCSGMETPAFALLVLLCVSLAPLWRVPWGSLTHSLTHPFRRTPFIAALCKPSPGHGPSL